MAEAGVEDEDCDIHPTGLLVLVSSEALHVVDTFLDQEEDPLANREEADRGIHIGLASPYSHEELRIPVVDIVVAVAYGHGLEAYRLGACRQLCGACLVGEQRSPP